ncbi:histidine kinase [Methanocella sp. CWC-04]|uniref:histidine kinase n=1 Tax=Methanooceanicella nereidis TaxID=2052831 RepID=A0AAP2RBN8_9EURY|nr:PAS domain-containing sensor histidine kinase [Methanocella sp. CWC-04]MCD1294264.1 histidine kinase [Methanocella sp. CWC-04]
MSLTIVVAIFLAIFVNVIWGVDIVYTHLFYIPIILSAIWYYKKAVYVAIILGVIHILINDMVLGSFTYSPFLRTLSFILIAYVIGMIAERKDKLCDKLKSSEDSLRKVRDTLELKVQERTKELKDINESLRNEINERKSVEEALRESELHFAKAQHVARLGSWDWDISKNEVKWSDEQYHIFGLKPHAEKVTFDTFFSFIHPDDRELLIKNRESILHDGRNYSFDYRIVKPDGSIRTIHSEGEVIHDDNGKPVKVFGTMQDITERKRSEQALKKSGAILSRAQSIAHVGNWAWNLKNNEINWSDEVFRIFGHDPQEFQPTFEWVMNNVHPEDRELISRYLKEAIYEDKLRGFDYRIMMPDGSIRYVSWVFDKIRRDINGNPEWMYGIIQDITRRKLVEEALLDSKAQAELYVDLMGHDINNMNQITMGYLELAHNILKCEGKLESCHIDLVERAIESLQNSSRLIGNVRKLQREKMGLYTPEILDVGKILEEVVSQFQHIPNRDVKINYTPVKGYFVEANELLRDVFINLIGNAVKHSTGPLTINVGVNIAIDEGKEYFEVAVEDNGPGIPDKLKKTLFDRLNIADTRARGKGFGLCLIKMLVDDFKGKLRVEDRVPGDHSHGTRFVVTLPALS